MDKQKITNNFLETNKNFISDNYGLFYLNSTDKHNNTLWIKKTRG